VSQPGNATLRLAVAGAGLIGRRHIALIQASGSCKLSAIVDPGHHHRAIAEDLGVPDFASLEELFASGRPDGVIVATPNAVHVKNGLECLANDVPVLVEKPIADSVEDGCRLAEAAKTAAAPLLVGHHRRHSPLLATARTVVQDGVLGPIVTVLGSALYYKPDDYFTAAPWRSQPGGGPILINLIHAIDDLRSLCGEISSVRAVASNATRGFAVEDTVAILLSFTDGGLGTFLLSDTAASPLSWEQTSGEDPHYPRYADEDCYVIAGTRGSLGVPTMRLKTYSGPGSWWTPFEDQTIEVERADPLERQLEHFCAVILGEAEPLVTGSDALQTLRVTLSIAEAARTGQPVVTG
jgi:predicted dehydrogenase